MSLLGAAHAPRAGVAVSRDQDGNPGRLGICLLPWRQVLNLPNAAPRPMCKSIYI
jgi:hypothetical protein